MYLKRSQRDALRIMGPRTSEELAYLITQLMTEYYAQHSERGYSTLVNIIGILESVKQELMDTELTPVLDAMYREASPKGPA